MRHRPSHSNISSFLHSLEGMRRLMSHENQGARASPPVRKTVRKSVSKADLRTIELSVSKETLYRKEGADSRFKGCGAVESIRAKGLKGGCGAGKKRSHEIGKRDRDHLGDHSGPIGQLILFGYSSRENGRTGAENLNGRILNDIAFFSRYPSRTGTESKKGVRRTTPL